MTRPPLLIAMYATLLLLLAAALVFESQAGDGWRSFWLTVALACFLVVRKDLTEEQR